MTKKSKRKAAKTGSRGSDGPRVTTFNLSLNITKNCKFDEMENSLSANEFSNKKHQRSKLQKNKLLKRQTELQEAYTKENEMRLTYPVDLWYHLAKYISPEQIQTFACICKASYTITNTKKFWMLVYGRFVRDYQKLPIHLKPDSIGTEIGLKARVIRSLYYSYQPFIKALHENPGTMETLEIVEHKFCEAFWWKQIVSKKRNVKLWMFYFKLKPYGAKCTQKKDIFKQKNLMKYNTEENYCLLEIYSPSFVNLYNPTGMCLTSINISVSRDMNKHKLKLEFHEYRHGHKYLNSLVIPVTINPVIDVRVLNWWHPDYPHPFDY